MYQNMFALCQSLLVSMSNEREANTKENVHVYVMLSSFIKNLIYWIISVY